VLGSQFDFGDDVFKNTSDLDQPTVSVHIQYGDVLDSMFYFGDVFGSLGLQVMLSKHFSINQVLF
jgi:hypothetical protein